MGVSSTSEAKRGGPGPINILSKLIKLYGGAVSRMFTYDKEVLE